MLVWEAVQEGFETLSKGGNGKLRWEEGRINCGWKAKPGYDIGIQVPDNLRLFQLVEVSTPAVPDEKFWVNYGMMRQLQLVEALARIDQLEREVVMRDEILKKQGMFITREIPVGDPAYQREDLYSTDVPDSAT